MIRKSIKLICCEDISLIDNYNEAINDKEKMWDCHHRLEIELNKTRSELIKLNLYYNRPATELIFLTRSEHKLLHKDLLGKKFSEATKQKMREIRLGKACSDITKQRMRDAKLGKKRGHYKKASNQDSGNMRSNVLF